MVFRWVRRIGGKFGGYDVGRLGLVCRAVLVGGAGGSKDGVASFFCRDGDGCGLGMKEYFAIRLSAYIGVRISWESSSRLLS